MPEQLLNYVLPAGATGGSTVVIYLLYRLMRSMDRLTKELHAMNANVAVALSRIDGQEKRVDRIESKLDKIHDSLVK